MSHNHGGGMSMDMAECKVDMLWNWYTIDACFLSSGWRIQNNGMFAASCIGIALMAVLLEAMRRISRDYDNYALKQLSAANANRKTPASTPMRATALQQGIRAILHTITFGLGYLLMLLAMYYNGYIIISILLGTGIGKFFCDWLVLGQTPAASVDECPTACCG